MSSRSFEVWGSRSMKRRTGAGGNTHHWASNDVIISKSFENLNQWVLQCIILRKKWGYMNMTSYDKLLVAGRCLRLAMQLFFGLSSQNIGMSGCCPTIACVMHALKCGLYCCDLLCIYIYICISNITLNQQTNAMQSGPLLWPENHEYHRNIISEPFFHTLPKVSNAIDIEIIYIYTHWHMIINVCVCPQVTIFGEYISVPSPLSNSL